MEHLGRLVRLTLLALVLGILLVLAMASPAQASLHTYHEQPGQTTYRSRQSLRDQNNMAWQATLFKRDRQGELEGVYLRLVGFPGQAVVNPQRMLSVQTGTTAQWTAPQSIDAQTQALPANVAQYDVQLVLAQLRHPLPLTLDVPLAGGGSAHLVVAPYVVDEWLELYHLGRPPR